VDAINCARCAAGKFLTIKGNDASTDCVLCDNGKYSSLIGADTAATCVENNKGKKSLAGSDNQANCMMPSPVVLARSVGVKLALSLPMKIHNFTPTQKFKFHGALARVAEVVMDDVAIVKIESLATGSGRRHLLTDSIRVETHVSTANQIAAEAVALKFTADRIIVQLVRCGIPPATLLEAPLVYQYDTHTQPPDKSLSSTDQMHIIDAASSSDGSILFLQIAVGCLGFVVTSVVAVVCHLRSRKPIHFAPTDAADMPQKRKMVPVAQLFCAAVEKDIEIVPTIFLQC